MHTLGRVGAIARPPGAPIAVSILMGSLAVGFGVALMTTAGYLISRAAEQPPILALTVTIVAVRFFGLARPLARYVERLVSHDAALRALGRIRSRFYERIEPLAPAQLHEYRSGELLARMVGDVDALQSLYVRGFGPPLVAVIVGAASVGVAAAVLPAAAAILALGLIAAGVVVPLVAAALSRAAGHRQAGVQGGLTADLVEVLRGAPELVAYGREEETLRRVRASDDELARMSRQDALAAGLADALSILVVGATVAGVLAVSVAAHETAALDRVLVATLALLALSSFDAVFPLTVAARELSGSLASGRRVLELTDRKPDVRDPESPRPAPTAASVVALEGVTATYAAGEEPALKDFDLRLEPRRWVALVGPSGAGKTTVTNLLLRFLDPVVGRVTIDGRDVREYRQQDVRATFALAGQDAHLFNASIRANLAIGRPEASDDEFWDALRRVQLEDWARSLPNGLDTLVGEEGTQLSGGQRRRLTIARALLSPARVLVLDEPTAHLDAGTAQALMRDVIAASGERIVLLITHRQEGVDLMDEVVECHLRPSGG
jgi:ATP-binding cassette, subfamily C, bacterial CydC